MSTVQYGFIKNRSTLTQQLNLLDQTTNNYDNNITSNIIYIDFSKAFDSVSHQKLLHILSHLKVHDTVLAWIKDFLLGRSQQTVVEGHLSTPCQVTSGVPLGSVLGPLLFSLFIEVLIKSLQKIQGLGIYAYADDVKILGTDYNQINSALTILETWSATWQLHIHPKKSEHLTICRKDNSDDHLQFFINSSAINKTDVVRDLGVLLTSNLQWHSQISKVYSRATNLIYIILKTFKSRQPHFYVNLFKLYVCPILEYNINIWMPYKIGDIRRIESLQAKFTRRLCQKLNLSYDSYFHRLQILNLETLEIRRVKLDLILTYKIHHSLVDLNFNEFFTKSKSMQLYNLRRHALHLDKPCIPKTTVRQNFFYYRVVNTWNQLPKSIVESKTLATFKRKLNSLNLQNIYETKL